MGARTERYCHAWLNLHLIYYSMAGHQRTADTPADGGRADTPAGGGQADTGGGAILRIGIHAYAMGEGGIRMEPQRGGRERCINTKTDPFTYLTGGGLGK